VNVSAEYYDWWFRYGMEDEKDVKRQNLTAWVKVRKRKTKRATRTRVPRILWEGWVVWWDGKQERFEQEHTDKMDEIIAWVTRTCNEIIANGGTLLDWGWHMF